MSSASTHRRANGAGELAKERTALVSIRRAEDNVRVSGAPGNWALIGPTSINDGLGSIGRIHSIAVDPTTPATIYAGGPRCGIWKTTDGGSSWLPVGDSLPTLAVAALAVDPVTPTRIYAVLAGDGIYSSDDAAGSWAKISADLGTLGGFGVLLVDPTVPARLYLTAGANGLHRSNDSGATWTRVKTGFVGDVAMHPSSPAILYAGVDSDGVYRTTSGGAAGDTDWEKLPGLPTSGFTGVTLCPEVPDTIYAGLTGDPFRVYRTTDGRTFALRYTAPSSIYNPWLGVDPADPAIVYLPSQYFWRSTDGGASFAITSGDDHECQKLVTVSQRLIFLGRDNGIFRSTDRGVSLTQIGRGISNVEIFDGALAATDPSLMIGGCQDNGTIKYDGSSTVWTQIRGGDGSTVAFDPTNAQILYAMYQKAESIARSTNGGGSFDDFAAGLPTGVCDNLQFFVHPTTPATLLACCTSLWQITSPSGSWTAIFTPSGDEIIRAAVDPSVDLYYAGSSSGQLHAGPSGNSWRQVFAHPTASAVTDLRIDRDASGVLYATFDGTGTGRVYRLARTAAAPTDLSTVDITANLPAGLKVNSLAVDPTAPFIVYVATNRGVYRGASTNNGASWSWSSYNNGLPLAIVTDLEVHPTSGVMRAATFGRSAYEVYTDDPVGSLVETVGHITFLRAHEVGSGYGKPPNFLDCEVIALLAEQPGRAFGFKLRAGPEQQTRTEMLDLLRAAFVGERPVRLDYVKTGPRVGEIIRVATP
jgi:hypothetical protein